MPEKKENHMESGTIFAQTQRLILRSFREEDLRDLFEYVSDEKVVAFEPYRPMTLEEATTPAPPVVSKVIVLGLSSTSGKIVTTPPARTHTIA